MPLIHIDRLTLRLSGLSEREGRRLAEGIAEGLEGTAVPTASSRRVANVPVTVRAEPGSSVDRLAEQIVAELLQQLKGVG